MRVSFGGIKKAHTAFCIPRDTIEDLNQPSLKKRKKDSKSLVVFFSVVFLPFFENRSKANKKILTELVF